MSGYLTFDIGGHELAAPLAEVREVVRIERLDSLPGLEAPVTGIMHLRGTPLPVCDLRGLAQRGTAGDVVVLATADGMLTGVAVDRVVAVVNSDVLTADVEASVPIGLPSYVVGVLRHAERPETPVFLVAMNSLVERLSTPAAVVPTVESAIEPAVERAVESAVKPAVEPAVPAPA